MPEVVSSSTQLDLVLKGRLVETHTYRLLPSKKDTCDVADVIRDMYATLLIHLGSASTGLLDHQSQHSPDEFCWTSS
jgi:hypothetical protein